MKRLYSIKGALALLFLLSTGCNQLATDATNSATYKSRLTSGCLREIPYNQMTNEALLTWSYDQGNLELYINIDTQCAASMKDSIRISDNTLTIVLEDTVSQVVSCACIYREVFYFTINGYEEVKILCHFKPQGSEGFKTILNRTLALTDLP